MSARDQLLADIENFLAATDMKATHFGIAVKDRAVVTRLRRGAHVNTSTIDKIRAYIDRAQEVKPSSE